MAYADAIKYNKIRSMKGLPIGTIVPWSGDQGTVPFGWRICNGATIENSRYPLLYDVIGNTYGGTPGSTYKLPPLTNNPKGIVDIYQGHYNFLKSKGAAHAPRTSSIANDPFWSIVEQGNNGDEGSSTQTSWISTIDVVGEFAERPNMFGIYDDITLSEGNYSFTVSWQEVRLTDYHLTTHGHSVESDVQSVSYRAKSARAKWCLGHAFQGWNCWVDCSPYKTEVTRTNYESGGQEERYANVQGNLQKMFQWTRWGNNQFSGGGGSVASTNAAGDNGATYYIGGDGIAKGNMAQYNPFKSGPQYIYFTNLSNTEVFYSQVAPHSHGVNTFNLSGKMNVIAPGIKNNITMNSVAINNSPGVNFCSITINSATPSLEMVYIIRAF